MTDSERKRRPIVQIVLLSAGLLILLGISASSIYLVYSLRTDADAVAHTLEVQNQIYASLLQVRRAESAERGYLLTSEPEFLTDFKEAEAAIRPAFKRLAELTADNPVQARHLNELLPLLDLRLREFNTVVSLAMGGQQRGSQQDRAGERDAANHRAHPRYRRHHARRGGAPPENAHGGGEPDANPVCGCGHRRLGRGAGAGRRVRPARAPLAKARATRPHSSCAT